MLRSADDDVPLADNRLVHSIQVVNIAEKYNVDVSVMETLSRYVNTYQIHEDQAVRVKEPGTARDSLLYMVSRFSR